jgi:universal stress protein E
VCSFDTFGVRTSGGEHVTVKYWAGATPGSFYLRMRREPFLQTALRGARRGAIMDTWQDVRKGLFVADAEVESARFLGRMVEMARRNGARLTVVHCLEEPSRWSSAQAKEVHALLRREWQRELEKLSAAHSGQGLTVDALLLTGDPVKEIASLVERDGYDFVAKVASDQEERGRLSSTEIDLIRSCPCNVWIDRPPPAGDRYQTVLLAVDCMDPDHEQLNHEMLEGAVRFAKAEDATLHVLHVWNLAGETMLRGRSFAGSDKINALVEQERQLHQKAFDALLEPYASLGGRLKKHLVKGIPMAVVMDLAVSCQIDVLGMGAGVRSGIGRWLIGGTAEQVLKVVPCAVFAEKRRRPGAT